MGDRGVRPVEWLQGLALSVERLAARGVASGALRGAADELKAGLPDDLDAQVRTLLRDGLLVLERLVSEAAASQTSPVGAWSQAAAESAVRGAVEEFRRLVPEMRPTTQELFQRLKSWLDRSAAESAERAQVIRAPGEQMRIAAEGVVAGAAKELSTALPLLAEPAADFASRVGRGFVRGAAEEVTHQIKLAGRSSVIRALIVGGAIVALFLAGRRR